MTSRPNLRGRGGVGYLTDAGFGAPDPTRYRLFPARLGSISCKPFGSESRSRDAAPRPTRSPVLLLVNTMFKTAAKNCPGQKARNTMAYQTVNPYDQVVASLDHLSNEQFARLIAQAQQTFGSWSQMRFRERAAVRGRAGVGVALVTVHHPNRQPEKEQ